MMSHNYIVPRTICRQTGDVITSIPSGFSFTFSIYKGSFRGYFDDGLYSLPSREYLPTQPLFGFQCISGSLLLPTMAFARDSMFFRLFYSSHFFKTFPDFLM